MGGAGIQNSCGVATLRCGLSCCIVWQAKNDNICVVEKCLFGLRVFTIAIRNTQDFNLLVASQKSINLQPGCAGLSVYKHLLGRCIGGCGIGHQLWPVLVGNTYIYW